MLKSISCDYNGAYIVVKGIITVPNTGTVADTNDRNKEVAFKNCAPFTDWIYEINNTQIDNAEDIDLVMKMYITE